MPSRVGKTGTAINDTLEGSIKIIMDSKPDQRWAETILSAPEDILKL